MSPPRDGVHHLGCVTIGLNGERLAGNDVSKPKSRTATDNQKLLILRVVVVAAARDPRMSGEERNLTGILRSQHFSERAAGVNMVGDWISKVCRRNVTEVSGVQRPQKSNPQPRRRQGGDAYRESDE